MAIDWDQTALHLRYLSAQEKACKEDVSVSQSQRAASEPITLNKCLEAFTREEELGQDEKYYCSDCKTHQLAYKKLQIWRLPPILIVHLKRFHLLNGRWIKSHKIVDFPFQGLDPTDYLAAVPGATLQRFKSLKLKRSPSTAPTVNGVIEEVSEPNSLEEMDQIINEIQSISVEKDADEAVKPLVNGVIHSNGIDDAPSTDDSDPLAEKKRRKRLESTSLINNPIKDDKLEDFHQHKLEAKANPLDVKYSLYSYVVSKSQGANLIKLTDDFFCCFFSVPFRGFVWRALYIVWEIGGFQVVLSK